MDNFPGVYGILSIDASSRGYIGGILLPQDTLQDFSPTAGVAGESIIARLMLVDLLLFLYLLVIDDGKFRKLPVIRDTLWQDPVSFTLRVRHVVDVDFALARSSKIFGVYSFSCSHYFQPLFETQLDPRASPRSWRPSTSVPPPGLFHFECPLDSSVFFELAALSTYEEATWLLKTST